MAYDDLSSFLRRALETSIDASPSDPGLTYAELSAVAERFGFRPGELRDVVLHQRDLQESQVGDRYHLPDHDATFVIHFHDAEPWRDLRAFDFVAKEFIELARELGRSQARIGREALLTRASTRNIDEHAVAVAVAFYVAAKILKRENGDVLKAQEGVFNSSSMLPSAMAAQHRDHPSNAERRAFSKRVLDEVRDVVSRRSDGRPAHADPLKAFAPVIAQLGYPGYEVWWRQHVAEHGRLDAATAPTASIVLAAALAEAALSFVFRRAAATGLTMTSELVDKPESHWQFIQLVKAAKKGATAPLLDGDLGGRCERLNDLRQRIHVGRFLSSQAKPADLDIREEEVREAAETLQRLVRRILDWLAKNGTS